MVTRWLNPREALRTVLVLFLSALGLLTFSPAVSLAQEVVTNITPSDLPSCPPPCGLGVTIVDSPSSPEGTVTTITGGARPGNGPNLFHSFGDFSIGPGDIANFFNDSGRTTSNIIGRVTNSGSISHIYGTIEIDQTFGNANLFLMNPYGIVLGPGALLDVGGSVSFTTAQYLRLFDGINSANFYANPADDSLAKNILVMDPVANFGFLSSVDPAAYGFLTAPDPTATITVLGSDDLSVLPDQSISLVGGKVKIEGGARLSAPNGRIQLATTASPGEFAAPPGESLANATTLQALPNVGGTSFTSFESVSLAPGSSIGGNTSMVFIKDGQIVLSVKDATLSTSETLSTSDVGPAPSDIVLSSGSSIKTSNSGVQSGADVQITAGTLSLDGNSKISTETSFAGRGGDLQFNVGRLTLAGGATLETSNNDSTGITDEDGNVRFGVGGDILIRGVKGPGSASTHVTIKGLSAIRTQNNISVPAFGFAGGTGGDVMIESQSITLDDGKITSESSFGFIGPGGEITLGLRELSLTNGGQINSTTAKFDLEGPGGKITIYELAEGRAPSVTLSGSGINGLSRISSVSNGGANPGEISITTGTLSLSGGADIKSGDPDLGPQGASVTIHASNAVNITTGSRISSQASSASAGPLVITTPRLSMNQGFINTSAADIGTAGDVTLNVGTFTLENGSRVESSTTGSGSAGSITVQGLDGTAGSRADSVTIRGPGGLFTETGSVDSPDVEGPGGNIAVVTNMFTVENGASISAASSSISPLAQGGSITINANLATVRTGAFITTASIRTTEEGGAAPGGNVGITARALTLDNGSISAATAGSGDGGDITITADQSVTLQNRASVSANSTGAGDAGNITINAGQIFKATNSSVTTESSQASGGQVTINARNMVRLIDSIVSTSVAGSVNDSNGGNISIDPDFVILKGSQILARADAGDGGAIDITAGLFLADAFSIVDATSTKGVSGTVEINAPINNLSEVIARLPESLLPVEALLRAACAAKVAQGGTSSFVERGRDSIPAGPEGLLASPYLPMASGHLSRLSASPAREPSDIQVRRLSGQESLAPAIIRSEHAACSL